MDYVGFFEDLREDFPRLRREIFPHARGTALHSAFFSLGNVIGLLPPSAHP